MKKIWKEYEFRGLKYKVSNYGEVLGVRGKPLKTRFDNDGYVSVTMGTSNSRTRVRLHRLVAELFVENPNDLNEVNHIDCNRANPRADNLEWITHLENIRHSIKKGNYEGVRKGEKNGRAKTSSKTVIEMRDLYDNKVMTIQEISKEYDRPWSTVNNIVKRHTWTNI